MPAALALSNLTARTNLLWSNQYRRLMALSVVELRDISRRFPSLYDPRDWSEARRAEWREMLFWGEAAPPLRPDWAEPLAAGLDARVAALEARPDYEAALELLLVARSVYAARPPGPGRDEAAGWDGRVCAVLARDEFRLTPDMVDQRLEVVAGGPLPAPPRADPPRRTIRRPAPPRPAAVSPPPQPASPSAVARPVQPTPFTPATTGSSPVAPPIPPVVTPTVAAAVASAVTVTSPPAPLPPPVSPPPAAVAPKPPARPTPVTAVAAAVAPGPPAPSPPVAAAAVAPRPPAPPQDPDRLKVWHAWPRLPDHVRKCVLMLIEASARTAPPPASAAPPPAPPAPPPARKE